MLSKIRNADNPENIKKAADILHKGGLIVHPTETIYGFAANALQINSIRRIDRIKRRSVQETYLVLVKDIKMAGQFHVIFNRIAEKLAGRFWPGPLTLVLPMAKDSRLIHLAFHGTIALRVSSDRFVKALFEHIDFPIISTSVNKSGQLPFNQPLKIESVFRKNVDLILERGAIANTKPSTIVAVKNNSISIIRKGLISENSIYGV
jgi:L-threonylcarbamoyladenylate synthase